MNIIIVEILFQWLDMPNLSTLKTPLTWVMFNFSSHAFSIIKYCMVVVIAKKAGKKMQLALEERIQRLTSDIQSLTKVSTMK